MLSFHPLTLSDKPWIDKHVFEENSRSADFNFGSMFLWDGRFRQLVSDSDSRLIALTTEYSEPIFPYPIGRGELEPVILDMREYALKNGFPFVIRGVEASGKKELEELFPGKFTFTDDRDFSDYIYSAASLIGLAGKKLHGKRNHINRFIEEQEWSFEPLSPAHFSQCLELLDKWERDKEVYGDSISGEYDAMCRAFNNFEALGLCGGALFAGGQLAAFTIGEVISSDTVDVHFEKAEAEINGAYTMINREFVKMLKEKYPFIEYINREDDMGIANLRKAKMSYQPEYILEKYSAHWSE